MSISPCEVLIRIKDKPVLGGMDSEQVRIIQLSLSIQGAS